MHNYRYIFNFITNSIIIFGTLTALCAQDITTIEGSVIDSATQIPIPYAHLRESNSSTGTITNEDGNYSLSLRSNQSTTVEIAALGYNTLSISIDSLIGKNGVIQLSSKFLLDEVIVEGVRAAPLVRDAFEKISENYSQKPTGLQAFYREYSKEDDNVVTLSEALIQAYIAPYNSDQEKGRIQLKLLKGRKKIDTIGAKSTQFWSSSNLPHSLFYQNLAHNPEAFRAKDFLEYSDMEIVDVTTFNGVPVYVVDFDQKDGVKKPLYKGTILIEKESLAIVSIKYEISPRGIQYYKLVSGASKALISLARIKMDFIGEQVLVNYQKTDSLWHLSNVKSTFQFRFSKKRKKTLDDIDLVVTINNELLISEINREDPMPIPEEERLVSKGAFDTKITEYDKSYWEGKNFIAPSEKIQQILREFENVKGN